MDTNTDISGSVGAVGIVITHSEPNDIYTVLNNNSNSNNNNTSHENEASLRLRPAADNHNNNNNNTALSNVTPPPSPDVSQNNLPVSESLASIELEKSSLDSRTPDESDDDDSDDDSDNDNVPDGANMPGDEEDGTAMKQISAGDMTTVMGPKGKKIRRRLTISLWQHSKESSIEYVKVSFIVLISTFIGAFVLWMFSLPHYVIRNNGTTNYFNQQAIAILNSTFFISGLALFTAIQFISVYGIKRAIETKFYFWVVLCIAADLIVPWGMLTGEVRYWYWLGDVLLLIATYCGLSFVMGYVGRSFKTFRQKLNNGLAFLGTEVLVSATALLYGMFFIQVYTNFSDMMKVTWRLLVHPVYFEIFMMIPVRLLVTKQMEKKGQSVMHSLAVVHAQAHISTLGRLMISTIGDINFTIGSVFLLNFGKLVVRSSVQVRDKYASKLLEKLLGSEHVESKKFVRAAGLFTEMIMENASIPTSAFMMWLFVNSRALFFLPYPSGESFTMEAALINVAIQILIAIPFDIVTLVINERYFGLPLERAWRKMQGKWLPFFGFLIYGLVTMGLVGVLYMAARVPRFITCGSQDVCSCMFISNCDKWVAENLS
ncbi:hypothetical protein SAMD00019534_038770 [Acytostelium subglobosum LB1]|uniref:hypothetical protein n=1 Tax=Acytostelium subglobosum LB1 TaxID=1410327 RepID=UPI000644DFC4|nr:hypothetical protein SAMD00019534_038770 [Acytostelium subglobosum LB1]GAM20702.1 hypothetical protein SAMD00019534_038770 [Acytostelium subglobosum LB1]|eukprot:XP_012760223.1 hypothetical protein SAMD00019534_038770 [Acytostelium subglobosum LB1]